MRYFYRTRVRSLAMLTHSLTHSLLFRRLVWCASGCGWGELRIVFNVLGQCWEAPVKAEVWSRFWSWIFVKLSRLKFGWDLKLNFDLDFEPQIWPKFWGWSLVDILTKVWSRFRNLTLVKILSLKFGRDIESKKWFCGWILRLTPGQDIEVEVLSIFQSWILPKKLRLNFGRDSWAEAWSIFWSWI